MAGKIIDKVKDITAKTLSFFTGVIGWIKNTIGYLTDGVWRDNRNNVLVRIIKTVNLSVRTFCNRDLQSRSMALTYSTVLALVPALALLFAIGRGFGFQNLLMEEMYAYFPSQSKALSTAFGFVDSYLKQASQGIFVGVGVIMLFWTIISLLGNIEIAFNKIWEVKQQRSLYRKLTDYTTICLLIPILMICSSGISIFMGTTLHTYFGFLGPMIKLTLDLMPFVLCWLAFSLSFTWIPNTRVKFKYAILSGLICSIAFMVLQMLFVNGQVYVSKYNAIYGSFAFLPLLLIWLQLSWLITLFGCLLTYASQNVLGNNYSENLQSISHNYLRMLAITIMAIIVQRHLKGEKPLSNTGLSNEYILPIRLVTLITDKFHAAGLTYFVVEGKEVQGVAPAIDASVYTVGQLLEKLDMQGESDFVPEFTAHFAQLIGIVNPLLKASYSQCDKLLLRTLPLPEPHSLEKVEEK